MHGMATRFDTMSSPAHTLGKRAITCGNAGEASMSCKVISSRAIASVGLIVLAAASVAQPAPAQTPLFDGARVISGDGGPAIENAAILAAYLGLADRGSKASFATVARN